MTAARMDRPRKRCAIMLWFLFICGFLQPSRAWVITCSVTQHEGQTTYTISGLPHVSGLQTFGCEYTWANGSQHVLAHNHAKAPEVVMINSINALVTSRCIEKVIYDGSCVSEGEGYNTVCTVKCPAQRDRDFPLYWIALIAILGLLVVLGLICFLCYRCKNGASSSGQPGGEYNAV